MSTKFLSPGWRMPRNANQSKITNYSLDFDGSNYIDTSDSTLLSSENWSISVWFKWSALQIGGNNEAIISTRQGSIGAASGFDLYLTDSDTILRARTYSGNVGAEVAITLANEGMTAGVWYHASIVYDSGNLTFKINNGDIFSGSSTGNYTASSNSLTIGKWANGANYHNGKINEVSIFNYALSASQVTTLWGGGTSVSNPMALPSPPIAYYPLGTSAYNGEYLAENNAIGDYVFDFDGSNDITVSHNSYFDQSVYSFSFWINNNLNSGVSNDGIITADSSTRGWSILQDNQTFKFNPNISGGSGQTDVTNFFNTTSTWIHCAITFDGTNLIIYKNGTSVGSSSSGTRNLNSNNNPLTIGNNTFASGRFFNGKLSNVQIFDTALSSTEAETLYNYGSPIRTLANIPQSSNLKAWYKLDASEVYNSTTTEWSIDNNQNPSAYPSSLNFNGSSNYIDCGTGSRFNINQITISAWVKLSSGLTNTQIIAGIRNNTLGGGSICYQLQNQASGKFRFVIRQSNGTYVDSVANDVHQYNTWYHVLGVADGSNIKLYVNGNLQTIVSSYDGTIYSPNENFNIGRQSSPSNYYWDGELSNVSVFNTGLTSAQVTEIYNNGTPSNLSSHSATSNLVSWWKLNNTTTGIEDAKGSNNGTNNGATEYTGFVNKLVGESSGMSQANLVQSDLQTVAPYSKYAIKFEAAGGSERIEGIGNTLGNGFSELSISAWVNYSASPGNQYWPIISKSSANGTSFVLQNMRSGASSNGGELYFNVQTQNGSFSAFSGVLPSANVWYNVTGTYDGNEVKIYINNVLKGVSAATGAINTNNSQVWIGDSGYGGYSYMFQGIMSNISVWDTGLTYSQVTEIYNQGLPGNLNSHSAYSNLVSWWQLGENSSFDGNEWLFADEKGSNNGESINMTISDLVNGVGTTANGVSSGMSEGNLVGDAPYSTANALSTNMIITSRVTGSGNTP